MRTPQRAKALHGTSVFDAGMSESDVFREMSNTGPGRGAQSDEVTFSELCDPGQCAMCEFRLPCIDA